MLNRLSSSELRSESSSSDEEFFNRARRDAILSIRGRCCVLLYRRRSSTQKVSQKENSILPPSLHYNIPIDLVIETNPQRTINPCKLCQ